MSKYPIKDEIDFLLAQAQIETDIAKEIVESLRKNSKDNEKSYYEEKVALKMLEFFKEEERLINLYVEAKKLSDSCRINGKQKTLFKRNLG
jgi:cell shape-determining protein MreC